VHRSATSALRTRENGAAGGAERASMRPARVAGGILRCKKEGRGGKPGFWLGTRSISVASTASRTFLRRPSLLLPPLKSRRLISIDVVGGRSEGKCAPNTHFFL